MFHQARLRLTAWYIVISMLVSITFSMGIYRMLTLEVERFERMQRFRMERRLDVFQNVFTPLPVNTELLNETKYRIVWVLVGVNIGIIVVAGGVGYILAGRTLAPIQHMVDEQHRFVTDASHELRTPLTALKSAFEVFLRDKTKSLKEAEMIITDSIGDVNRLQSLSESLLQLAQYQEGSDSLPFEPVSLSHVLGAAIRKIEPLAKKKKIAFTYAAIKDSTVLGNPESLIDVFVIFLDNAVKYSPTGHPVHIHVRTHEKDGVVSILDKGSGIAAKDLPYIFDRFYRADAARSHGSASGYGLGLSIAKRIVTIHHGSIHVTSRVGVGSTFSIRLPRA